MNLDDAIKQPTKTVKITKEELAILKNLNNETAMANSNIALFIRQVEKEKKALLDEADKKTDKINDYMTSLKKKYKVIGLKDFNFLTGEMILE